MLADEILGVVKSICPWINSFRPLMLVVRKTILESVGSNKLINSGESSDVFLGPVCRSMAC